MLPNRDEDFFWTGIDEGRLTAQRCKSCNTLRHPPAPMCAECQSLEWEAQTLSGKGTVYSWLVSRHPTQPDAEPRIVVLVNLEEGIRLVGNMLPGESTAVDDPVRFAVGEFHGMRLPMFTKGALA
jgi:uncharacterized OB-fold protein